MTARRVVRTIGLLLGTGAGLEYGLFILSQGRFTQPSTFEIPLLCTLGGAIFGFFGLEYVTVRPFRWMENKLRVTPLLDLAAAIGGLTIGLLLAALAAFFLRDLPFGLNIVVSAALALLLGYWGVSVGLTRRDEMMAVLRGAPAGRLSHTVLDTSVIIDGRIGDIARSGFLTGRLIAPHFVLAELQGIADSPDAARRQRGRRGLELLEDLKRIAGLELQVTNDDFPDVPQVDHKLIRLAQKVHGGILTTDYNLNRVAQLEGVPILNINELANALKPAMVPGDELTVTPIKQGKEFNQGVAYLADGTMVVVEGGRSHLGQAVAVRVTGVHQTAAGRMIFAAADAPAATS